MSCEPAGERRTSQRLREALKRRTRREAKPQRDLSGLSTKFLGLFQGGRDQVERIQRAGVHLMVLRDVTIARAMQLEGMDMSEMIRVRQFFKKETRDVSKEIYAFSAVGLKVLAGPHTMTREETSRLESSLTHTIEPYVIQIVRLYKAKAQAAAALGESLEAPRQSDKPQPPELDDDLCIICLEDQRSTVYRPCLHRVCCQTCAEAYWQQSRCCPWCRGEIQEV